MRLQKILKKGMADEVVFYSSTKGSNNLSEFLKLKVTDNLLEACRQDWQHDGVQARLNEDIQIGAIVSIEIKQGD